LESIAGNVFVTGKSRLIHRAREKSETSVKTDQISNTQSNDLLALPLNFQGKCIGVIEFLNKKEGQPFDDSDLQHAERNIVSIALKVGEFIQDPKSFQLIGITPKRRPELAAILFSDLSKSSRLIKALDAALVTDILNQYFETLGTIAITHGGRIDKFIGDGFMITFNVQYSVRDPEVQACAAALEMNKAFDELKGKWNVFNAPELYNRIGIDYGPVHKVEIGHSHLKQITVMGDAVNLASNFCQIGSRDKNTIIVGESVFKKVLAQFNGSEITASQLSKPIPSVQKAYELVAK
jgi:class 3 adenylate cyclase